MEKALHGRRGYIKATGLSRRFVIPQTLKVYEFGAYTPEIIPDAAQDLLDLRSGFFRKGSGKIFTPETIFRQQRTDHAHRPTGEIAQPIGVDAAQGFDQRDR